jgi:chitodextrinase
MQYNYSHGNEGAGYLFAQYSDATFMDNNICRYNISENDGKKNSFAGIQIWAATGNTMSNSYIYGNTVITSPAPTGAPCAIGVISGSVTTNTQVKNNIFITTGGVNIVAAYSTSGISFQGNNYWSSGSSFNISWGNTNYSSLAAFRGSGQESGTGFQVDPMFENPNAGITLNNTDNLTSLTGYRLKSGSPMIDVGLTILNPGARDYYGNAIPFNNKFDIGAHEFRTTDTQSPIAPTLSSTGKTSTSVSLSWTGATDNVGVTGYDVYNGTTKVNTSAITATTFTVSNLSVSIAYNFTVKAFDAVGNTSPAGNTLSVTTNAAADTQAPTAPTLSSTSETSTSVSLSWTRATDNVGVAGYEVYNGTTKVNTTAITSTSYTVNSLNSNTAYNFTLKAFDAAGNTSAASNTVIVTTNPAPDTQAPAAPTLTSTGKTSTSVSLSWTAATDNVAVTGYDVYNGTVKVNNSLVTGTTYTVSNLIASTAYQFTVTAKDAAGNSSIESNRVKITTPGVVTNNDTFTLSEANVSIYPNPTEGIFSLNIDDENEELYNITVINVIGNKIYKTVIQKNARTFQAEMNITAVPAGLYYVELYNDHSKIIKKVFKN